ncbi:hypothetical protein D3C71_932590 [compost metagenome]
MCRSIHLSPPPWEIDKNDKVELEDLAIKPGVAVEDLTDEKLTSRVIEFSSERFSNDRLSNRLSDLCGLVRTP